MQENLFPASKKLNSYVDHLFLIAAINYEHVFVKNVVILQWYINSVRFKLSIETWRLLPCFHIISFFLDADRASFTFTVLY